MDIDVTKALENGPHDRVEAGDATLAHWRFGHGPDVVLVHGWPLWSATWRAIVPALARRFTVHLFDLPGVGFSPMATSGRSTFASHARALRAAIDALGLGSYALVSHDSGAVVARLVAADDPRVRAFVMGNTELPNHEAWQVHAYVTATKIPSVARALMRAMRFGLLRRSPFAFGGCFADARFADGEFRRLFVDPIVASPAVADGHLALVRDLDFDVIRQLDATHARIAAPTLLVWGPDDPFFPIAKARRVTGQFPGGARLVEIPGKLFAHEERPDAFVAHVGPFLARALLPEEDAADQLSSSSSEFSSTGLNATPRVCTATSLM